MLTSAPIAPTIPVTDLQRAKEFYHGTLGFEIGGENPGGIEFKAGENTTFYIYKRGPSKADHTLASFMVKDVEATVDELTQKGIVFEQYDFPGLKTNEKGIAELPEEGERGAWFKDPDGNILAIGQEIE
jgi:catechol 2,3-dioxygenase-like lactoylglutathione lyase family enzyme